MAENRTPPRYLPHVPEADGGDDRVGAERGTPVTTRQSRGGEGMNNCEHGHEWREYPSSTTFQPSQIRVCVNCGEMQQLMRAQDSTACDKWQNISVRVDKSDATN